MSEQLRTALTRIYNTECVGDCVKENGEKRSFMCVHVIAGLALGVGGLGSEKAPEVIASDPPSAGEGE